MATRYKNSVNNTDVTGWTTSVVPTNDDLAVFDSQIGALSGINFSNALFPGGSFAYLNSTPASSFYFGTTVSSTTFSMNRNLAGPTGADNLYSVYVAPNKTFSYDGSLRALNDAGLTSPIIFVDSGASIVLNQPANDSYLGALASENVAGNPFRITKRGEGWILTGRGVNPAAFNVLYGGVVIQQGEVRLDGGRSGSEGYTSPLGSVATEFNALSGSTPTLRFATSYAGVNAFSRSTRTLTTGANFTTDGTIAVDSGFTATMQGAFTGSGTFTKSGAGTLSLTGTGLGMSLVVNAGTLSLAAGYGVSGATLSGAGTLALSGATLASDAPSFTGTVSGTVTYTGATNRTFGGSLSGDVTISSGPVTFTAANSGVISAITSGAAAKFTGNGKFNGGAGSYTFVGTTGQASVDISGPNAGFVATQNIGLQNGSFIYLRDSAIVPNLVVSNTHAATTSIVSDDTNTNTYSGYFIADVASGQDNISAKTDGTLVVSNTLDGYKAGRTWDFNGTGAGYSGKIRLSGAVVGLSPARLSRGTLHLNSAASSGFSAGLSINSGTLACSAPSSAAYAAQIAGALTFSAGTTLKFGAPA